MAENKQIIKELVKSDGFQELLKILAVKMREIDTVRDIDITKTATQAIATTQASRKLAIEIIESWLAEILDIVSFNEFSDRHIEKKDDIIQILKDDKNKF